MLLAACKSCICQRLLWPIAFALTRRLRRSKPRVRGRGASDGQVPVEEGLPPHADDLHRGGARFRRRQHLQSELPGGGVYVMYIRTIYSRSIDQSSWIPRRQACLFVERSLLVFLLRHPPHPRLLCAQKESRFAPSAVSFASWRSGAPIFGYASVPCAFFCGPRTICTTAVFLTAMRRPVSTIYCCCAILTELCGELLLPLAVSSFSWRRCTKTLG